MGDFSHMIVTRLSSLTGLKHTMDIPLTKEEYQTRYLEWRKGTLIQDAFPMLSCDQREFIKSGITPEEWHKFFGEDE
jgi:hypothetical protein